MLARQKGVARLLTVGCDFHFAGTWRAWIEPPYGGFPDSDYESNRCTDEATVPSLYNGGYVCIVVFLFCLQLGGPRRQMLLSLWHLRPACSAASTFHLTLSITGMSMSLLLSDRSLFISVKLPFGSKSFLTIKGESTWR